MDGGGRHIGQTQRNQSESSLLSDKKRFSVTTTLRWIAKSLLQPLSFLGFCISRVKYYTERRYLGQPDDTGVKGTESSDIGYIHGLKNIGNTCFANVVFQSLASLPSFCDWLSRQIQIRDALVCSVMEYRKSDSEEGSAFVLENEYEKTLKSTTELFKLLSVMNKSSKTRRALNPYNFFASLRKVDDSGYYQYLNYGKQQDAHEMFELIIEKLTNESLEICNMRSIFFNNLGALDLLYSNNIESKKLIPRLISKKLMGSADRIPLAGLTSHVITCKFCGFVGSTKHQIFNSLSVPITGSKPTNINSLLDSYFREENISSWCCSFCTVKNTLTSIRKKIRKLELKIKSPDILESKKALNLRLMKMYKADRDTLEHLLTNKHVEDFETKMKLKFSIKKVFTDVLKKQYIASPPNILCIHIQRTTISPSGYMVKTNTSVGFKDILDINPWMFEKETNSENKEVNEEESYLYKLKAVVLHVGDYTSGHFLSYRSFTIPSHATLDSFENFSPIEDCIIFNFHNDRNSTDAISSEMRLATLERLESINSRKHKSDERENIAWYMVSDEKVTRINCRSPEELECLKKNVYILFYERINLNPHK